MKKYLSNILVFTFLLTILVGVGGVAPVTVHAQGVVSALLGDVVGTIVAPVSLLILRITSLLTILSGGILNFVVDHTIVKMAANYKEIDAISSAWGTVRDVANMGFIFILLYASIQMILGEGKDTRKLIVNIIIAALLINFSMFFTQIIIDASNIIALTFYHAIAPTAVTGHFLEAGLSNSLMAPLHFETIWDNLANLGPSKLAIIGTMGSVITLIAAFIFFAIALMLVIRYVVLILVLILSPIAFIGDVIPGASDYAKQWRNALFGQAFFAPVYMFLTWITIKLFNDSSMFPTSAGESWASAFGGEVTTNTANVAFSDSSVGLVFNFVVIIVFLIATLVLSKKVSESAGLGINNLTKKAMGFASGTLVGGTLRNTVGRIGAFAADNANLQNAAKNKVGLGGAASRLALYASKKARSGTFDIQNAAVPTGVFSDAIRGTVGRTETGKKLGLDQFDAISSINISDLTGEARGGNQGYREIQAEKKKKFDAIDKANDEEYRKAQSKIAIERGTATGASSSDIAEMQRVVKDMSNKEIIALDHNTLATEKVAEALTAQHLKAINDSDRSETEKREIFTKHFAKVSAAAEALSNPAILTTITPAQKTAYENTLKNISEKEMDFIPTSIFDPNKLDPTTAAGMTPEGVRSRTFIETIAQAQVDSLTKGDRFIASEKQAIKDGRARPLDNAFATGSATGNWTGAMDKMRKMNVESLVKLDPVKLIEPGILDIYRPALLNKMAARSELTDNKAAAIRTAILTAAALPGATPEVLEAKSWLLGDGLKIF